MRKYTIAIALLGMIITADSCKKDKNTNTTPVYTVPTTYNFTNVDYTNQKKLLLMADQLVAAINLANTNPVTAVNAQKLKDMFNNTGNYFTDSTLSLNGSGLKLADYCSAAAKADLMRCFDSIAAYSQSAAVASNGVAGIAVSPVSSKKLLLSPTGIFYSQLVKKIIMGGICAYEIANVYLADSISNSVDNKTVVTGAGTAMEHHWDEAFGFFGVPIDFPTNKTGSKYFGSYSNQVDPGLGSNASIMNAFLKGRAAISAKDLTTRDAQAKLLKSTFDTLNAACIVQEMKETDVNIVANDFIGAYSTLSETMGFIYNMKYNTSSTRVITDAQITQLLSLLDSANPNNPNLYNFVNGSVNTTEQIKAKTDAIRQMVGKIYGFSATQLANQ